MAERQLSRDWIAGHNNACDILSMPRPMAQRLQF